MPEELLADRPRDWLTTSEVAARCGVTYHAVRGWITDGCKTAAGRVYLKTTRMVGRLRIPEAELVKFLEACNGAPTE